jgi:hypothetical protein
VLIDANLCRQVSSSADHQRLAVTRFDYPDVGSAKLHRCNFCPAQVCRPANDDNASDQSDQKNRSIRQPV